MAKKQEKPPINQDFLAQALTSGASNRKIAESLGYSSTAPIQNLLKKKDFAKKVEKQQADLLRMGDQAVRMLRNIQDAAEEEFNKIREDPEIDSGEKMFKYLRMSERISKDVLKANGVLPSSAGPSTVIQNVYNSQQNNQILSPIVISLLQDHIKKIYKPEKPVPLYIEGQLVDSGVNHYLETRKKELAEEQSSGSKH